MAKVFRHHNGVDTIEDWGLSQAYGSIAINGINDPAGGSSKKQITSIPSPFARIDLVQTAFKHISKSRDLIGSTIYHKMASDCWDVGEIFFNIDRFSDRIKIIVWDKGTDLRALINSTNKKHQLLGETLKLYLDQDKQAYNFDEMNCLYLLNYFNGGSNQINIIGGTSPSTLFFTSANNQEYVDIQFGRDKVFDDNNQLPNNGFKALYERDFEFQKYIYCLKNFIPKFSHKFKEVYDYLEINYTFLSNEQKQAINNITIADFESKYHSLSVGNDGFSVEILGFPLRKRVNNASIIEQKSDFVIASSKYSKGVKPLVLPNEKINEPLLYTTDFWESNNKSPNYEEKQINERILPFVGDKYPYLTISDLLEPRIIRTVYPINRSKFFDGNYSGNENGDTKGYILPLKKTYFDFLNIDDLQGQTPDGKPNFEIRKVAAGGISVTLRIPIKRIKYITFNRIYYPSQSESQIIEPDLVRNRGVIIENQFGLSLYPFLKLKDDKKNHYRVCLRDRDILPLTRSNKYKLNFFKSFDNRPITIIALKTRSKKETDGVTSDYYVLEEGFDFIEVKNNWANGIIIPLFKELPLGNSNFTFAVDFGTTNTHIEYSVDGGNPIPFEIKDDIQIVSLHDPIIEDKDRSLNGSGATILLDNIKHELMPDKIGKEFEFRMPLRTAIGSHCNIDLNTATFALADLNISFIYEKYSPTQNTRIRTNLKWSNYVQDNKEIKGVEAYFENLLLLIRNKILLNGGDLNKAKLIWFYPSSMMIFRRNMLESKWNELFRKYFNSQNEPQRLSESIAPFYYFNKKLGVGAANKPVVSMDIGGGTSDIVVYTNNKPQIITSFRFAANSIFGDAFNGSPQINGFVMKYLNRIQQLLTVNKQPDLIKVLEDINNSGHSEDIIAFFFSIENNKKIKDQNIPILFNKELALDNDFKIIFLLFYSSLIYHLAKLMKAMGLSAPRYITFSGTGSKVINIADSSPKLVALSELTKLIFNKIIGSDSGKIELKQFEEPKEITCKGGLMIDPNLNIDTDTLKKVLLGCDKDKLIPSVSETYNTLNKETTDGVIKEFENFIELFFELHKGFNFSNNFGVNPLHMDKYKAILLEDAMEFLKSGLENKIKDLQGNNDVDLEETLFFYPLIGGLNRLAYKIYSEMN